MLSELTPEQFTEWQAFDQIEPLGMERMRQMFALGFSEVVNATRLGANTTPEMFSGDSVEHEVVQFDAEQIAIARQITAMQNGSL